MEKEQIKENLNTIPEIKKLVSAIGEQLKAYFSTEKPVEKPTETSAAPETPKAEFDFAAEFKNLSSKIDEHTTSIEGKFKAYDEKLTALETEFKTAKETIGKQDELLKSTKTLVEKIAEIPSALSTQKPKDKVNTSDKDPLSMDELSKWREKYSK